MKNKKTKIIIITILIAISIITLWIRGTIPKQIAKISVIIYTKINFPKMQLQYSNIEWSKYHGDYIITFKDQNNENYSCCIGPKYFPIIMGQGKDAWKEEYQEKYEK